MKILKSTLLLLLIALVFIILFIIPGMIIPVSENVLKMMNAEEMEMFFPLLILLSAYFTITFWLVIRNADLNKLSFFLLLSAALVIIYPLMGLLESLFWMDAFKGVETEEFINVFYRQVITFILFSAFLTMISRKKNADDGDIRGSLNLTQLAGKIILIAAVYFLIYNLFGYFVAWQFSETRVFYTGSTEIKDFFSAMAENISNSMFVIFHIFRGMLFGLAGLLIYRAVSAKRLKLILIFALIFGGFGFQIVLPNPFFPETVRISHFIETTLSMLLFGAFVGFVFSFSKHPIKK